jgi:hypothetical protein
MIDFAGLLTTFGGLLDWAVPTVVLTVPGLLLLLAIAAQVTGGLVWIPIVRRFLGVIGLRRRRRHPDVARP